MARLEGEGARAGIRIRLLLSKALDDVEGLEGGPDRLLAAPLDPKSGRQRSLRVPPGLPVGGLPRRAVGLLEQRPTFNGPGAPALGLGPGTTEP